MLKAVGKFLGVKESERAKADRIAKEKKKQRIEEKRKRLLMRYNHPKTDILGNVIAGDVDSSLPEAPPISEQIYIATLNDDVDDCTVSSTDNGEVTAAHSAEAAQMAPAHSKEITYEMIVRYKWDLHRNHRKCNMYRVLEQFYKKFKLLSPMELELRMCVNRY